MELIYMPEGALKGKPPKYILKKYYGQSEYKLHPWLMCVTNIVKVQLSLSSEIIHTLVSENNIARTIKNIMFR